MSFVSLELNRLQTKGQTHEKNAHSEKSWVKDPSGIAWETFQTMAVAQIFSDEKRAQNSACCVPENKSACC